MLQAPVGTSHSLGMPNSRPVLSSRWCGSRLERDDGLREGVLSGLKQGWSPEQVAGRLAREAGRSVISHETIYRFIYGQLARKKDYSWRHYLPRAKSKRGWRGRKGWCGSRLGSHIPRDHLPVHLRTVGTQEGLFVAPLSAEGQVETGLAGTQRRELGLLHHSAPSAGRTSPGGR